MTSSACYLFLLTYKSIDYENNFTFHIYISNTIYINSITMDIIYRCFCIYYLAIIEIV
jgi:hypothetical protein